VNIFAKDYIDGIYKQFMATFTSYTVAGYKHFVFTPLGGNAFLFDDHAVLYWAHRVEHSTHWTYRNGGE